MGTAEPGEKVGVGRARNRCQEGFALEVEAASVALQLKMGAERVSGLLV
jgi:hypothetical protein